MNNSRELAKIEIALMNEIIERLQLMRPDLKGGLSGDYIWGVAWGVNLAIDEIKEMIEETSAE